MNFSDDILNVSRGSHERFRTFPNFLGRFPSLDENFQERSVLVFTPLPTTNAMLISSSFRCGIRKLSTGPVVSGAVFFLNLERSSREFVIKDTIQRMKEGLKLKRSVSRVKKSSLKIYGYHLPLIWYLSVYLSTARKPREVASLDRVAVHDVPLEFSNWNEAVPSVDWWHKACPSFRHLCLFDFWSRCCPPYL